MVPRRENRHVNTSGRIHENKAVIRRLIEEVYAQGNLAVADEPYTANAVRHGHAGRSKGPEFAKQITARHRQAFPDLRLTIEDMILDGDKVAVRWASTGTNFRVSQIREEWEDRDTLA